MRSRRRKAGRGSLFIFIALGLLVCAGFFFVLIQPHNVAEKKQSSANTASNPETSSDVMESAAPGQTEPPKYTSWSYSKNDGIVEFAATVYGFDKPINVPVLRCGFAPFTDDREAYVLDKLQKEVHPDIAKFDLIYESINGETGFQRVHYYAKPGSKEEDPVSFYFYDGTVGTMRDEHTYYWTVTAASMADDIAERRLICGDLPFASREEVVSKTNSIFADLGFDIELWPYIIRSYSMSGDENTLDYRTFDLGEGDRMEPYKESLSEYGEDLYQLRYRQILNGIPVSYYEHTILSSDYSAYVPAIDVWYNKNGIVYFVVQYVYSPEEVFEAKPLISIDEAAEVVAEKMNMIMIDQIVCNEISLEYVGMPFQGFKEGMEADMTPMWVFYFDGGVDPVVVNAISGKIEN